MNILQLVCICFSGSHNGQGDGEGDKEYHGGGVKTVDCPGSHPF